MYVYYEHTLLLTAALNEAIDYPEIQSTKIKLINRKYCIKYNLLPAGIDGYTFTRTPSL